MRISDWSSDVCSSDLNVSDAANAAWLQAKCTPHPLSTWESPLRLKNPDVGNGLPATYVAVRPHYPTLAAVRTFAQAQPGRSEEHTPELQSLMRISYAVFCLKKKTKNNVNTNSI